MTKNENELFALQSHATAYQVSISRLESEEGNPETIALEKRNLAEVMKRIDQLKTVKASSASGPSSIPSVR